MKFSHYVHHVIIYTLIIIAALVLVGIIKKPPIPEIVPHVRIQESQIPRSQKNTGKPVTLAIPSINVHAQVEYVGVNHEGMMGVPLDPDNVGWFSSGVRPGEEGTAVIDGHRGWRNGREVVFDNLYKLQPGDKVYSMTDQGTISSFIVSRTQVYDPDSDTSSIFYSDDGRAHLNLITCSGFWNRFLQTSSERLVVFTDYESELSPVVSDNSPKTE